MAKKLRVYELAKHYGVDSPSILKLMRDMHAEAKSHMSVVEDDIVDKIHARFQRQREILRQNYAKAHRMDPEKLKHVASFRPLDRPQPSEDPEKPEPEKKAAKKAAKKKTAKKKTTKKAATKKTTAKKAATKKATTKKAATKKAATKKAAAKKPVAKKKDAGGKEEAAKVAADEADIAAAKDPAIPEADFERTGARPRARIVRKADVIPKEEPAPEPEQPAEPVADVEAEISAAAAAGAPAAGDAQAEGQAASATEEKAEAESEEKADEQAGKAEGPAKKEEPVPVNRRPRRRAKIIRLGSGVIETTAGKKRSEGPPQPGEQGVEQNWDWADVRRDMGVKDSPRSLDKNAKDSVRESVQAAVKRRMETRDQSPADSGRRKRRQRRKKVDEVAVAQNVKQTLAQIDGARGGKRRHRKGVVDEPVEEQVVDNVLRLTEFITVQELAEKLDVPAKDVIAKLFAEGVMVTMNQRLDKDTIEMVAVEFEHEVEFLSEYGEEILEVEEIAEEDLESRAPVVTVMGHVDHGKTSLLDYIRHTNVIAGEAGGITQHIGAYRVETPGGPITFLDTPGHEAFSAMRARGAQVTDIVILIVAADDRIMPQTIEAINHAKAAGVPIIVAINKIDLPGAKPEVVKQEMMNYGIVIEEFGGDVLCAEISAKKGIGIEKLLEQVHLQAEVLELTATSHGPARGAVVEASKELGRGTLFTVLIDQGTLKVGDNFLAGRQDGKVRALLDERGEDLQEVHPGEPAVVMGAHDVPEAGDRFYVLEHGRDAREIATRRRQMQRMQSLAGPKKQISLENLADMVAASDVKELPIIVKGDVSGSVEAVCDALLQLNTEEVQVKIVHKGVGAVNESDVLLASSTGAMIIGFHMRPGNSIREHAKEKHVTIEVFDVIYECIDTMKKAMAGLLGSIKREVSTGSAEVREVFRIPKVGTVAGSYVTVGTIIRNSLVRLVRDQVVIFEGKISSLKRFKEDAREVQSGFECGIGLENFHDLQEGDHIETFRVEEVARTEL